MIKKKQLNPSENLNRIIFLEKLGNFTKEVGKELNERKVYYQDKDLSKKQEKSIITLSPKQKDQFNCKSKK